MKNLLISLLFAAPVAFAQDPAPSPPEGAAPARPAPPSCDSEKHRQFDFWVGEWNVTTNGQPAGHNRITLVYGDCALREDWSSVTPYRGGSFNIYDRANDKWHQTWVDSAGTLLELDGGMVDGKMVLTGQRPGPDGSMTINRITWTPNDDGSVRQLWETSTDGETWTAAFDGLYVPVDGSE